MEDAVALRVAPGRRIENQAAGRHRCPQPLVTYQVTDSTAINVTRSCRFSPAPDASAGVLGWQNRDGRRIADVRAMAPVLAAICSV